MKIALMGYSRSGKDSVAEIIRRKMPVVPIAFADTLKDSFHEMFPNIPRDPKPRMEYEKYGQAMRDIDADVWIHKVANRVRWNEVFDAEYGTDNGIVITDLRKPNEADWCRANGFKIVNVTAHTYLRRERAAGETEFRSVLPSEEELWMIDYDCLIPNNYGHVELERNVDHILNEIRGGKI